jgi:hypothetical protein
MIKFGRHFGLLLVAVLVPQALRAQNPIHVTYLWHMHQPIYYPYENINDTDNNNRFNFSVRDVHNDRAGNYTSWPKNAVQQGADRGMPHAGAQCSFSGSLGENLNNIWASGWPGDYRWARNGLRTTFNNPRLDMVGIGYHHSLMPLTCHESMKMQIRLHKEFYKSLWNTADYSKGFWPPECAFATWIIPALVEEGLEWVIVDNGHFDRACKDYPWVDATSIRPNPADQLNPNPATIGSQWVELKNVWAPSKVSAPWGYQPHWVKHVNPWTGAEQKIIAVPAARYEGNENGRGGYGAFKPENVWGTHAANGINNNPSRPMLLLCHSDGDNYGLKNDDAWHNQHGYFLSMCQSNPHFDNTTVQDYLQMFPVPAGDVIHIEPGSWIGIDGGTPYFDKWREWNPGFRGDPNEHPDFWSWSVIVAAQNRVLHAEKLEGSYSMNDVRWGIGPDTAKAWHYYLQAETSCHWYWDYDRANPWDGNTTRGCNLAIAEANKVINRHPGNDSQGPSIFPPQRDIYNPGGKHWNETTHQPSTFQVWSFIDDVSGVAAARLYVRSDLDGENPIPENDNEVYAHNPARVSAWTVLPMTNSWYPAGRGPLVPEPANRARKHDATVSGYNNVLLDYFIEAVDNAGNTNRSDIMHVYVGASVAGPVVTFLPAQPEACQDLTLIYNPTNRPLQGITPVKAELDWQPDAASPAAVDMALSNGLWRLTTAIPAGQTNLVVHFHNGSGTVDDNSGQKWSVRIAPCYAAPYVVFDPTQPAGCDPVSIKYYPADGPLNTAPQVNIHVGFNGWQGVIQPNPAMTLVGDHWEYSYQPPAGAYEINCVFNNGNNTWDNNTWDNNNGQNWKVAVSNCLNTNAVVTFTPGVPRDCDDVVVAYNPSGRNLAAASPVRQTITFDEWLTYTTLVMAAAGDGTWIRTNTIPAGTTRVTVNFRNQSETLIDDNDGKNWLVSVSACNTSGPSVVSFNPAAPNGCNPVTIFYRPNSGPLRNAGQVYIHIGHDNWQDVSAPAMTPVEPGVWSYVYHPPPGSARIDFCFNDGLNLWDNNATHDWLILIEGCGPPSGIRFAPGTPLVPQGPTNQQNYVGETFDLNQAGGYASTSNQGGFGHFGRVFINYDANYLYLGAYDVDLASSNHAMALFLEVNTLHDNAANLWDLDGPPNGLDNMHNVAFAQKADLAILLGDEWGDGTHPDFELASHYNMGQGIYYLSLGTTSFVPVAGAKLNQFDGVGTTPTGSTDDDGNAVTTRWKAALPWNSLGSTNGINGITNCWLYGLMVSDGVSGADRYISGNYLGTFAPPTNGNYGFSFVTLQGIPVELPSRDENLNGVPDDWEMQHFGSLGVVTPISDWDGDGMIDVDEYFAGSHPKDFDSCFEATHLQGLPGVDGKIIIQWKSFAGRTYDLFRATNFPIHVFDTVELGIPTTPPINVYTDNVNSATVIYKIETR